MICTFFGHRDAPQEILPKIENIVVDLIESKNVHTFYVGNQGNFDAMVRVTLKSLQVRYPHIRYAVVLAYLPEKKAPYARVDPSDTIYPEGLESTPPRFAIAKRNRWLVEQADIVVAYVKRSRGGAATFTELAKKREKAVIYII